MSKTSLAGLLWMCLSVPAMSQDVTVQQPVVGTTSVNTSVMVPDRGRVFLGGVSSAQSSRSRFGFWQPGSSVGEARSSKSISAGVTIVDLREMDEAILSSVADRPEAASRFTRHAAAIQGERAEPPREMVRETETRGARADRFEQLARKAEAENRAGVAKLHWQMAAKYGSTAARQRLVAHSR